MALNQFMHKRNPFRNKRIDFTDLCAKFEFAKLALCDEGGQIVVDFKKPEHLAVICRALLLDSFSLDVIVPLDRLIPTVPLRLNYLLWLEDLLQNVGSLKRNKANIKVLDIGAGAICIYGLLGARLFGWHFIATEIDSDNVQNARRNVANNSLNDHVEIVSVTEEESTQYILRPAFSSRQDDVYIDFVMCNPPFFGSSMEKSGGLNTRNMEERDDAKSINSSHRKESIVDGGEVHFTQRLIDESILYKDRVGIFTVMLGKKTSSEILRRYLQEKQILNLSIYEMCQGRVMRWGLAWSFLPQFIHPKSEFQLKKVAVRHSLSWNIGSQEPGLEEYSLPGVYTLLKTICQRLDMTFLEQRNKQSEGGGSHLLVTALRNTWSHQRRRRRELQRLETLVHKNEDMEAQEPEIKRRRIEDHICEESDGLVVSGDSTCSDLSSDDSGFVLKYTMNVVAFLEEGGLPAMKLDLKLLEGDKEALNQVMTYIKNQFKKTLPPR